MRLYESSFLNNSLPGVTINVSILIFHVKLQCLLWDMWNSNLTCENWKFFTNIILVQLMQHDRWYIWGWPHPIQYEKTLRKIHQLILTASRLLVFTPYDITSVHIAIDGKPLSSKVEHVEGPLYVSLWQPELYSSGLHQITVTVEVSWLIPSSCLRRCEFFFSVVTNFTMNVLFDSFHCIIVYWPPWLLHLSDKNYWISN